MTSAKDLLQRAGRGLRVAGVALGALLLSGSLLLVLVEPSWSKPLPLSEETAFLHGSSGTEIMPLPVFQVLPALFPDQFQPAGAQAGDWIDQFGFTRGRGDVDGGLSLGFAISNHRPRSGAPSPVPFVGFTCGMCHTGRVQQSESDPGTLVLGMGSPSLDFIAWVDAFKTALLDEQRMTVDNLEAQYEKQQGRSVSIAEKGMIGAWLRELRARLVDGLPRFDAPYSGAELRDARFMSNGPGRTQPFRNLVRNVMDRPATLGDRGYCKIPSLFEQKNRAWGQYDGSVGNPLTRSVLAALAVGATLDNLIIDDIAGSVSAAIEYTKTLPAPRFAEVFPEAAKSIEPDRAQRGKLVYEQHCQSCHGERDEATRAWVAGPRQGEVLPLEVIGTDPERVTFRYYQVLSDILFDYFPADHPLKPKREDLRPGPLGRTAGFINAPLEGIWARAPYLHNGSVSTLAELINLEPRRDVFYRGRNFYDSERVGMKVSDQPSTRDYYRYDTRAVGNSNAGHDYPWAYRGPGWDEAALRDLLAYLKTID